ncbi:MAG: response regulator [bacterium]|nr:response regulator [bacterium]
MAKILIVEDDAHVLRILSMWLTRNGHEVFEACDGQAAKEVLDASEVDVVVSDMNMPRMNGIELARWVRAEKDAALPMVILSSRCDQDRLAGELKEHDIRVIPKPFSPSRLVVEIERLVASTTVQ